MQEREKIINWNGDSLKIKVLFSRAGVAQQIWAASEQGAVLIDTGDGILRDITMGEIDLDKIEVIFFTHGHFDHIGGLYSLLGFLRMIGREKEIYIFAPDGCDEVVSMIENFVSRYSDTIPFKIFSEIAEPGESYKFGGMTIQPFPVIHCGSIKNNPAMSPIPAVGYKISSNNDTVVISGDTGDCESLRENVKGADLAIIEATYKSSSMATEDELKNVHLSEDIAEEIGKSAKEHILVHKGRR